MKAKVIGGGFAGCEACYQLLKRGVDVTLVEGKFRKKNPVQNLDSLCEVVCSNSFKSNDLSTASGCLKQEMRLLDSIVIKTAEENSVPAGGALAVDREKFSQAITAKLLEYPDFHLVSEVCDSLATDGYDFVIVATGPLTDDALIPAFSEVFGENFLYFFDAVAPIITADSIDFTCAFTADRYGKGTSDYVNCPMNKQEYTAFYNALVTAETAPVHDFDNNVFEGCMPVEIMASRGEDAIRFGPLKPVGLIDERTGKRPYANVQLRKENAEGTLYNLVGFQTHLKFGEQKRVFSMIPALHDAEFVRYGVMHRNTYINAPQFLDACFCLKTDNKLYFAGQITGVEGYMESAVSGLVAGLQAYLTASGKKNIVFPQETITGALCNHISKPFGDYTPMNANFGILPPLEQHIKDKHERKIAYSVRAVENIKNIVKDI